MRRWGGTASASGVCGPPLRVHRIVFMLPTLPLPTLAPARLTPERHHRYPCRWPRSAETVRGRNEPASPATPVSCIMSVNMNDSKGAIAPSNRPHLEWLTVSGFKSIASVQKLEMRSVNVVIGANGSGKSNLVNVFSFLESLRAGRLANYVTRTGGADRILHFGAKTTDELTIAISFQGDANQYEITLVPDDLDRLVPLNELGSYWDKPQYDRPYTKAIRSAGTEAGISKRIGGIGGWIQTRLDRCRVYHFHDTGPKSPLKRTCSLHDNDFLRSDGSNLAAFLYLLQAKHKESYDVIRRTIRLVAPFFDDFILRPDALTEAVIRLEWRHVGTDAYFDASSLSDGTLRFMAMATLLLQPAELLPSLILLDEPELGLHPFAVTMFCSLVKSASVKAQLIIATQSPLVLDHFEPEDVLVAERRDGASKFTRLATEGLEVWLSDYSLGQLWEKNELGGRPNVETWMTP